MVEKKKLLRNYSTSLAREIWEAVDIVAAKAPEWMQEKIRKLLKERREAEKLESK